MTHSDAPLPATMRVTLDPATRIVDDGTVVIGGSPLRISRLTPAGAARLARLLKGEELGAGAGVQRLIRRLIDSGALHPDPSATAAPTRASVGLVVPVKDHAAELATLLETVGDMAQITVVDDGSTTPLQPHPQPQLQPQDQPQDRSGQYQKQPDSFLSRPERGGAGGDGGEAGGGGGEGVRVIRHESNRGPAAARQTGWRATATEFVAFVDADVQLGDGWLEPLLAHFSDPTVAGVAPRVRGGDGPTQPAWLAAFERDRSPLDLGVLPAPVRPRSRVSYVPTAVIVVRRSALEDVGGFDESLRFGEDVDLVWRLSSAGWRVRYEPSSTVAHVPRPTLRGFAEQRFAYGSSAAALDARHPGAAAPLMISGWSALAWGLALFRRPLAGAAVAAASTAMLVPKLTMVDDPRREAIRLAGAGNLWAGRSTATALMRSWWPLSLALGVLVPRTRPALVAALGVPALLAWRDSSRRLDPVRFAALAILDDVAYGAGVWVGCARARSAEALRPVFTGKFPPA